jgi:hypothetical protein
MNLLHLNEDLLGLILEGLKIAGMPVLQVA